MGGRGLLTVLARAGAVSYIGGLVVTGVLRLGYPYPFEVTEPTALIEVERVLHGQALYVAPTLEHVPLIYGPVYFCLSAGVALLTGPSYVPLRLVSLLASLGALAVIFRLVQRETANPTAGLLAAGLFAACNPLADSALDLGRVDALFTFEMLLGLLLVRAATSSPTAVAAGGILLGLAGLTKVPMAVLPIAAAVCLYLALTSRRALLPFLLGLAAVTACGLLALRAQSGAYPTWYLIDLPRQHGLGRDLIGRFWLADLLPRFTLPLLLAPVAGLSYLERGDRRTPLFFGLTGVCLLATAWASRANGGGAPNVLLPAFAALAMFFGLGLHEGLRQLRSAADRGRAFEGYLLAVCAVQLALLALNPRDAVPGRTDLLADERLAQALQALPGPVFAPDLAGYLRDTDQAVQPLTGAVDELLGGYGGHMTAEGDAWQAAFDQALREHRYTSIALWKTDCCLKNSVRALGYSDKGPLIASGDDFYFWRAPRTPEVELYVGSPG